MMQQQREKVLKLKKEKGMKQLQREKVMQLKREKAKKLKKKLRKQEGEG